MGWLLWLYLKNLYIIQIVIQPLKSKSKQIINFSHQKLVGPQSCMFFLKLRTEIVLQNIWPSQFGFASAPHSIITNTCRIRAVFGSPNPKILSYFPASSRFPHNVWQKPHLWFDMAYPQKDCDVRVMFLFKFSLLSYRTETEAFWILAIICIFIAFSTHFYEVSRFYFNWGVWVNCLNVLWKFYCW